VKAAQRWIYLLRKAAKRIEVLIGPTSSRRVFNLALQMVNQTMSGRADVLLGAEFPA
jgi:hypothetical protein